MPKATTRAFPSVAALPITKRLVVAVCFAAPLVAAIAWWLLLITPASAGDTYIVDTTSDANLSACTSATPDDCSLRGAIEKANGVAGHKTLDFDIPGTGVHTIMPGSPLPPITDTLTINGYSQSGASENTNPPGMGLNTVLKIELDGTNAGANENGLSIDTGDVTIRGVVINRFDGDGIHMSNSSPGGNVIQGNFIGTNVAGTAALGNLDDGIQVASDGGDIVGGDSPGDRNLVSGNGQDGIYVYRGTANVVQGNFVGTDVTGTAAIPNGTAGIAIESSDANVLGGTTPGAGNLVSGNGFEGITITVSLAQANEVLGNIIGAAVNGTAPLPNATDGVRISHEAHDNTIGGEGSGEQNLIAFNGNAGVNLFANAGGNNYIGPNVMHANGGLGIDLNDDGATANDQDDPDAGPNDLQNYPVLTSAVIGGSVSVSGSLNSAPNTSFNLLFFSNTECDTSGFGEGRSFLGSITIMTDGGGDKSFAETFAANVPPGDFITATASNARSTSEFSECVVAQTGATPTPSPSPTPSPTGGAGLRGDGDCDGDVDLDDLIAALSEFAGVDPGAPCANLANVDCDGDVDAMDALRIAAYYAGVPMTPPGGCGPIGEAT